jgi:hypothetical protein
MDEIPIPGAVLLPVDAEKIILVFGYEGSIALPDEGIEHTRPHPRTTQRLVDLARRGYGVHVYSRLPLEVVVQGLGLGYEAFTDNAGIRLHGIKGVQSTESDDKVKPDRRLPGEIVTEIAGKYRKPFIVAFGTGIDAIDTFSAITDGLRVVVCSTNSIDDVFQVADLVVVPVDLPWLLSGLTAPRPLISLAYCQLGPAFGRPGGPSQCYHPVPAENVAISPSASEINGQEEVEGGPDFDGPLRELT